MSIRYNHIRMCNINTSGDIDVLYPENKGNDVLISRANNSNIPASVVTAQDLVDKLISTAFTTPINDSVTNTTNTWSSSNINTKLTNVNNSITTISNKLPFSFAINNGVYGYKTTNGTFVAFRLDSTETFTFQVGSTGSTVELEGGARNIVRYVNASNVYNTGYNRGLNDGSDSAKVGNALAADVLSPKTYTSTEGIGKIGQMPNRGSVTNSMIEASSWVSGYYSGNSVSVYNTLTDSVVASDTWQKGYYKNNGVTKVAGATYDLSTSDRTIISTNRFVTGNQVLRGVKISGVSNSSGNVIKSGTTIKIGDTGNDTRFVNVTGQFAAETKEVNSRMYNSNQTQHYQVVTPSSSNQWLSQVKVNDIQTSGSYKILGTESGYPGNIDMGETNIYRYINASQIFSDLRAFKFKVLVELEMRNFSSQGTVIDSSSDAKMVKIAYSNNDKKLVDGVIKPTDITKINSSIPEVFVGHASYTIKDIIFRGSSPNDYDIQFSAEIYLTVHKNNQLVINRTVTKYFQTTVDEEEVYFEDSDGVTDNYFEYEISDTVATSTTATRYAFVVNVYIDNIMGTIY